MKESGHYPPGAEHDPRAPYNEKPPEIDPELIDSALADARDLIVSLTWLKKTYPGLFLPACELSGTIGKAADIIDALEKLQEED